MMLLMLTVADIVVHNHAVTVNKQHAAHQHGCHGVTWLLLLTAAVQIFNNFRLPALALVLQEEPPQLSPAAAMSQICSSRAETSVVLP